MTELQASFKTGERVLKNINFIRLPTFSTHRDLRSSTHLFPCFLIRDGEQNVSCTHVSLCSGRGRGRPKKVQESEDEEDEAPPLPKRGKNMLHE